MPPTARMAKSQLLIAWGNIERKLASNCGSKGGAFLLHYPLRSCQDGFSGIIGHDMELCWWWMIGDARPKMAILKGADALGEQ